MRNYGVILDLVYKKIKTNDKREGFEKNLILEIAIMSETFLECILNVAGVWGYQGY